MKAVMRSFAPLLLLSLLAACGGSEPHIEWREGPLSAALQEAGTAGGYVVADVYATWCGPCKAMERDIWETPAGLDLVGSHVAWRVDFDTDAGQEFKRRYKILGLPTVLFLRPDGSEIDRVQGYGGAEEFLAEAGEYLAGRGRLETIQANFEQTPEDPSIQVRLGELLLVRGQEQEATRLLESAASNGSEEIASEALFLLGRYFSRAAERPADALPYWRRLHDEHAASPWGGGALYWLLKSYKDADRVEEGMSLLAEGEVLRESRDYEISVGWLESLGKDEAALDLARIGLEKFPESEDLASRFDPETAG